ncbi:MAG: hypothetical protein DRP06_02565 [Candidatus Aenigmatarchaeota archaeon]|nr:MAG: hypothetical protein DRP06_02565 [Candidatus Aenigmarchaeota archaeon]
MKIKCIGLKKIFNSRGEETIESTIFSNNKIGIGSAPSGASVGTKEAKLVDLDTGLKNFNKIKNKFIGKFNQEEFDLLLMNNLEKIGSNLTTSLSFAFFNLDTDKFLHKVSGEIPIPMGNVIGGGVHHGLTDIQEILLLPVKSKDIFEGIKTNFAIMDELRNKYKSKFLGVNDEGALVMNFSNEEALGNVLDIAKKYKTKLGIDLAASELFSGGKYIYKNLKIGKEEQIDLISQWIKDYKLYFIEDPFEENDISGFRELTKRFRKKCLICGDDLFATQITRLDNELANACIIKPNQVGTVTGALECITKTKELKMVPVLSHRSGETCDSTIARLSLLTKIAKFGISQIRISKLNELIRLRDLLKFNGKRTRLAKL